MDVGLKMPGWLSGTGQKDSAVAVTKVITGIQKHIVFVYL